MASTKGSSGGAVSVNILLALSFSHFINDMLQSLLFSIYPILKASLALNFTQIGTITMTYQLTSSLLQPAVGIYTDKNPKTYSLPFGMVLMLTGIILLSHADQFITILMSAAFIGTGSAIFHPEASRMTRAASGGKHGLAQSFFQVGGNAGTAFGPLLAAYLVLPNGQQSICWFSADALLAIGLLVFASLWYKAHYIRKQVFQPVRAKTTLATVPPRKLAMSIFILMLLIFSKYFYIASMNNYYMFYLMNKFYIPVHEAQIDLFIFLGAIALGTLAGGPIGDRFGRKRVIWISILGPLPFTVMLPYADLFYTVVLSFIIGFILASALTTIIVYAQELIPGKPGTISGIFFGFAFGMSATGAIALGKLADKISIELVYQFCAWLPAIGLLTVFLPDTRRLPKQVIYID
ncbi:MAG TPA: MFS transporter [Rickettsiales bacterium]|nr:MFS transporter [Rickettsiales bacterium]